ncbi:MAG: DUF3089 domain-containing protein [Saprospiraceae bacterium]|nr:DUF3089 domain-containing protein [Saprospiraceae bacterium]
MIFIQKFIPVVFIIVASTSCSIHKPRHAFDQSKVERSPDYKNSYYWAALPFKVDSSDRVPGSIKLDYVPEEVDVFFLHPTSYFGSKTHNEWNASMTDAKVNKITDDGSILYQASIFNGTGRVFAPRFRQAHYFAFFTKDKNSAKKAFDLAYQDVYKAFLHYYDNWNNNRPLIIAAHSQGSLMAIKLLKEVFDNEAMKNKLIVAYVVGYPVPLDTFKYLKPCKDPFMTSCICSWRTYKSGSKPKFLNEEMPVIITNPLTWENNTDFVSNEKNIGMVIDMDKDPQQHAVSAQVYKNILWSSKPKFKGSFFLQSKNYHKGDFNLYYMNVRENSRTRVRAFYKG